MGTIINGIEKFNSPGINKLFTQKNVYMFIIYTDIIHEYTFLKNSKRLAATPSRIGFILMLVERS